MSTLCLFFPWCLNYFHEFPLNLILVTGKVRGYGKVFFFSIYLKMVTYYHCATILASVIFVSFEIMNKNFFISLFMMTCAVLNVVTL